MLTYLQFLHGFAIVMCLRSIEAESKHIQWQFGQTEDVYYTNRFDEMTTPSHISCVYACVQTGACVVANYNTGTRTCALVSDTQSFDTNMNWNAYNIISGNFKWYIKIIKVENSNGIFSFPNILSHYYTCTMVTNWLRTTWRCSQ